MGLDQWFIRPVTLTASCPQWSACDERRSTRIGPRSDLVHHIIIIHNWHRLQHLQQHPQMCGRYTIVQEHCFSWRRTSRVTWDECTNGICIGRCSSTPRRARPYTSVEATHTTTTSSATTCSTPRRRRRTLASSSIAPRVATHNVPQPRSVPTARQIRTDQDNIHLRVCDRHQEHTRWNLTRRTALKRVDPGCSRTLIFWTLYGAAWPGWYVWRDVDETTSDNTTDTETRC